MTSQAIFFTLLGGMLSAVMAESPLPPSAAPSQDAPGAGNTSGIRYHMIEEPGLTWHCPVGSVLHPLTCECHPLLCPQGRQLVGNRCLKQRTSLLHQRGLALCLELVARLHTGNTRPVGGSPRSQNASLPLDRFQGYLNHLVDVIKATFQTEANGIRVERAAFWATSLECDVNSVALRHVASVSLVYKGLRDVSRVEESLLESASAEKEVEGFHVKTSLLPANECHRDIFDVRGTLVDNQCAASTSIKPSVFEEYNFSTSNQHFRPFEALSVCAQVQLQDNEFFLSHGGRVLHVRATGAKVTPPFFSVETNVARVCVTQYLRDLDNNTHACMTQHSDVIPISFPSTARASKYGGVADILSVVCTCVSVTSLLVALVTYCAVRRLRTVAGSCHVAFMVSLALAQISSQLGHSLSVSGRSQAWTEACVVLGLSTHFLWLSAALWLHVCTALAFYSMVNPLSAAGNLVSSSSLLLSSSAYCLILPAALLLASLGASFSLYGEIAYGGAHCFIQFAVCRRFFFALPLGFVVVVNIALYIYIVVKVRRVCSASVNDVDCSCVATCARLSAAMGLAWLFSYVHEVTDQWGLGVAALLLFGLLGPLALWGVGGRSCRPVRGAGLCQGCCRPDPRGTPMALPQADPPSLDSASLETCT